MAYSKTTKALYRQFKKEMRRINALPLEEYDKLPYNIWTRLYEMKEDLIGRKVPSHRLK